MAEITLHHAAMSHMQTAQEAASWIKAAWQQAVKPGAYRTPERKEDDSPVTVVDMAIEQALRGAIMQHYPHDGIIGEEQADYQPGAKRLWYIDPIDGTKAFMAGFASYTTLLALVVEQNPVLGIVYQPVTGECWVSAEGKTILSDTPQRTSDCSRLVDALFSTTSPEYFEDGDKPALQRIMKHCRWHQLGGDGYAYAKLASGYLDIIVEANMKPHDFLAHIPLVEAAGGVITDWEGQTLSPSSSGKVVASANSALHQQALEVLAG
jgi:inositol-phosphate phosphatase / L-galactose 1-phosphate phosphatase / histidinol-phosphatase